MTESNMDDRLHPFAELLAAEGVPEDRRSWALELLIYVLRGDAIDGLNLEHVSPWVAYSLGGFTAERMKAADASGYERALREATERAASTTAAKEATAAAIGGVQFPPQLELELLAEALRRTQKERDEFRESALMYAAAQTEQVPGLQYLLWDMERQMWWAPDRRGYTDEQDKAGRYSQAEAVELALQGSLGGLRHATVIVADHGSVKR